MKNISIHAIYGIILVVSLTVVMLLKKKECPETDNPFYNKVMKQKDEKIESLNQKLLTMKIALSVKPTTIIKIKKEYVPVFKEISNSTIVELETAFDSLITE